MSLRSKKVSSLIKEIIAPVINEISREHKAGLATLTSVRVTDDLQIAKLYVSSYAGKVTPPQFINILENEQYRLKEAIAHEARLRLVPELQFYLDDTLDQMEHIQSILEKAKEDDKS